MGMDAKADVFYGYSYGIRRICVDGSIFQPLGINRIRTPSCSYLLIEESHQHFDWDYGIQPLKTDKIHAAVDGVMEEWNGRLRKACEAIGIAWDESKAGWFVVCEYS